MRARGDGQHYQKSRCNIAERNCSGEDLPENVACARDVRRTEENPANQNEMKSDKRPEELCRRALRRFRIPAQYLPPALRGKTRAVPYAPDHECPACAVPKASDGHRENQIRVSKDLPARP